MQREITSATPTFNPSPGPCEALPFVPHMHSISNNADRAGKTTSRNCISKSARWHPSLRVRTTTMHTGPERNHHKAPIIQILQCTVVCTNGTGTCQANEFQGILPPGTHTRRHCCPFGRPNGTTVWVSGQPCCIAPSLDIPAESVPPAIEARPPPVSGAIVTQRRESHTWPTIQVPFQALFGCPSSSSGPRVLGFVRRRLPRP